MTSSLARREQAMLVLDARRVVARLFLPGEDVGHSRVSDIVDRVMALPEREVEQLARRLLADFAARHSGYRAMLLEHASIATAHIGGTPELSAARSTVLGASFTAEYAVEAAALCNPSAVLHPDQAGLEAGAARVAISLRGIGEGHISSIGFCTAVVGPGRRWTFGERNLPASTGTTVPGRWRREQLRAVLNDQIEIDELGTAVLRVLPDEFTGAHLEAALAGLPRGLRDRSGTVTSVDLLRRLVSSTYIVTFPAELSLDQLVLLPSAAEESNGMEDARFTRFIDDDGAAHYRATYTAYDGHRIAPRLLTSSDLRTFTSHQLAGPAARDKGMALFPRKVGGQHLALCRSDGQSTGLTASADGLVWTPPIPVQQPSAAWEVVQVGNCGPPLETGRGWLVLTHGVGPMRSYAISALLLDLDDPSQVIGRLERPLIEPANSERDGYVPNVVYSCGAIVYGGMLWLPFGIDDSRIAVASVEVEQLLSAMGHPGKSQQRRVDA